MRFPISSPKPRDLEIPEVKRLTASSTNTATRADITVQEDAPPESIEIPRNAEATDAEFHPFEEFSAFELMEESESVTHPSINLPLPKFADEETEELDDMEMLEPALGLLSNGELVQRVEDVTALESCSRTRKRKAAVIDSSISLSSEYSVCGLLMPILA